MHEIDIPPPSFRSARAADLTCVVTAVLPDVVEFFVDDEGPGCSFHCSSHAIHTGGPLGQLIPKPPLIELGGSWFAVCCREAA